MSTHYIHLKIFNLPMPKPKHNPMHTMLWQFYLIGLSEESFYRLMRIELVWEYKRLLIENAAKELTTNSNEIDFSNYSVVLNILCTWWRAVNLMIYCANAWRWRLWAGVKMVEWIAEQQNKTIWRNEFRRRVEKPGNSNIFFPFVVCIWWYLIEKNIWNKYNNFDVIWLHLMNNKLHSLNDYTWIRLLLIIMAGAALSHNTLITDIK